MTLNYESLLAGWAEVNRTNIIMVVFPGTNKQYQYSNRLSFNKEN